MPEMPRYWKSKEMKYNFEKLDADTEKVSDLINRWIFSERDRKILKRSIIDGITFEKLAEEFDLSVQRVKTIVYKGENIIFKHL